MTSGSLGQVVRSGRLEVWPSRVGSRAPRPIRKYLSFLLTPCLALRRHNDVSFRTRREVRAVATAGEMVTKAVLPMRL